MGRFCTRCGFRSPQKLQHPLAVADDAVDIRVAMGVLSREEVSSVLKQWTGKIWIIVVILYGAGLRIQDCLGLRVKDIDFDRHQIVVRRGKGQKDVRTMLPVAVRDRLRAHVEEVKRQHERDLARGVGRAVLPFALDRIRTVQELLGHRDVTTT